MRRVLAVLFLFLLSVPSFAADPVKPISRIAFGSCADQEKPQPIWDAVAASKPELFLFIGDIIYADTQDLDVMRKKYDKLAALPGFQKLLKTCPLLGVWDDHDMGANDAGADYPKKKESQQILLDFLGVPKDSSRRKQEGVYHSEIFGPPGKRVQVILLDTRYFRSPLKKRPKFVRDEGPYVPNTDPGVTFLGEAQWKWLEDQLRLPAEVRILASSIQVVAEDHGWEKWMNLPAERDRLYKLIRDTKAAGLFIISGDRHLAELSMQPGAIDYPLYDLTSSGINQASKKWRKYEPNRYRVATMNTGNNFGLITIDWEKEDPRIGLQIRDEEGDVTIQEKINMSLLRPGSVNIKPEEVPHLAGTNEPLTAGEIKKHLDKEVTIEMTVNATGMSGSQLIFLNSSSDFKSDDNFTVVLSKAAQEALGKAGIKMPRDHFKGKVIRVTGKLTLFREKPQIIVEDAKQIEVVK